MLTINIRTSNGRVAIGEVMLGAEVIYKTRAWGDAFCARRDAEDWAAKALADEDGRIWSRVATRNGADLWRAHDADRMAHGYAVCITGDEPAHATWNTTTDEAAAWRMFANLSSV